VLSGTCAQVTRDALNAGVDIAKFAVNSGMCLAGNAGACIKTLRDISTANSLNAGIWLANNMPNC
jgi:hypothetical protein